MLAYGERGGVVRAALLGAVISSVLVGTLLLSAQWAKAQQTRTTVPAPTVPAQSTPTPKPPTAAQPAPANSTATNRTGAVRSTHGAWQLRCDTPPGAQSEQCALFQSVEAADRPNVGLVILAFRTADQRANLLRVIAPLGVLLTSGLGLRIDDANIGATDWVRCLPNGCVAEARLTDELLGKLRAGKSATFIIFLTPEEGVGIPVTLDGFGAGFDAIK